MKISKKSRSRLQIQKIVFTTLLLITVGLLAWLSSNNSVQTDWSANNRNSISQKSIDVLNAMPDNITAHVYIQDDAMTHQAVSEILNRYQRKKSNFNYKIINPDLDLTAAKDDNIKQYGQVVIRYQDKKEVISSLSERAISSALLRLSHNKERNIVFITGHGERKPTEANNQGYSQLTQQLQSDGFNVKQIHLLKNTIPNSTSALVIAGASNQLLAGEVKNIQDYIATGGNLLWLADPGPLQGLEPLAEEFGLDFYPGLIVDNNIDLRNTLQIEHPAIIPILEYYEHKITDKIKFNTLFPTSRGINIITQDEEAEATWQGKPLFASFEQSWSESDGLSNEIVFDTASGDIAGPITLGIALQRKLNESINSNKTNQRIVVVGDSDFLANSYIGAGANLALGVNMLSWLAGDNTLLSIEQNRAPDTTLILNDIEVALIGMGFFIAIPLFLLICGMSIWLKRRNT